MKVKITASANLKVAPDSTKVTLNHTVTLPLQADVTSLASAQSKNIIDTIKLHGLNLRLTSENNYPNRITIENKYVTKNYTYNGIYSFEMPHNPFKLAKITDDLIKLNYQIAISPNNFVKNTQELCDNLLAEALGKAKQKCLVIANALNKKVLDIDNVDYFSHSANAPMLMRASVNSDYMESQEINLSEEVTAIFDCK